jgi:hypothetical protein
LMPTAWSGAKTNNINISNTVSVVRSGSLHRSRSKSIRLFMLALTMVVPIAGLSVDVSNISEFSEALRKFGERCWIRSHRYLRLTLHAADSLNVSIVGAITSALAQFLRI